MLLRIPETVETVAALFIRAILPSLHCLYHLLLLLLLLMLLLLLLLLFPFFDSVHVALAVIRRTNQIKSILSHHQKPETLTV